MATTAKVQQIQKKIQDEHGAPSLEKGLKNMAKVLTNAAPTVEQVTQNVKEMANQTAITPQKEPEVLKPAEIVNDQIIFTQKHLDLIKNKIAKDATQEEYDLFIMMARRTRLDPLLNQLYFVKYGGKPQYITSIDSYRIIAHRTLAFAGVDLPIFEYGKDGKVTHASITVYKLVQGQRFGFSAKVSFSEYTTRQNQWVSKPETMLAKVAEAHALRKAFPNDLSGIYTQEEMEQAQVVNKQMAPKPQMIIKAQAQMISKLMIDKGVSKEKLKSSVQKSFQVTSIGDLTLEQAGKVITKLKGMPDVQNDLDLGDDSFAQMAEESIMEGEVMPEVDVDEIDAGIEKQRAEASEEGPSDEIIH